MKKSIALHLMAACAASTSFSYTSAQTTAQESGAEEGAVRTLPAIEVRESNSLPIVLPTRNVTTGSEAASIDTPFSVTNIPVDVVNAQAGTTLQDALRNVPGAQADSGFNGSQTQFFILRGAIADSATGSNRILRDGARLSNYPFVAAFVDSVDVLRGPGAALGLRSEPGGTVNLVSKQPELSNFASIKSSVGSSGAYALTADVNRVLSQENELAARLIVTRTAASEWRHVPDKLDGMKMSVAKSDGNLYHLRLGVEATNQKYQPDYGIPSLNGSPVNVPRDTQYSENWGDSTTNNRIVDMHGDVALGSTSRLNVDYTHLEARSTSIKTGLFANPNATTGVASRFASYEPGTDRLIDSVSTTVEDKYKFAGLAHQVMWGIDYYRETLNAPTMTVGASIPSINVFNPVYGWSPSSFTASTTTVENLESTGASLQDQIDIGDWKLIAGLRYVQQYFLYGTQGVIKGVNEEQWLPKLGVLRKLNEGNSVYANVARGMAPNQVYTSKNVTVPSRLSSQVELGWKSLWASGKLESDIALYQLDQSNMTSSDETTPSNRFDFTVDGTGRSKGLEASLTGNVTEQLSVRLTYAYTDAQMLDNSLLAGKRVANVSPNTMSLWGQYQWAVASEVQWLTGLGIYAQSARFADRNNTVVLPGFARVDLTQTWRKPLPGKRSVEVQLAVRNVFDANYYVSSHLHTSYWITPGEGRNASVSMNYQF